MARFSPTAQPSESPKNVIPFICSCMHPCGMPDVMSPVSSTIPGALTFVTAPVNGSTTSGLACVSSQPSDVSTKHAPVGGDHAFSPERNFHVKPLVVV